MAKRVGKGLGDHPSAQPENGLPQQRAVLTIGCSCRLCEKLVLGQVPE